MKLAAKRREARARARAAEESADPNAWPTSETLTNRLRALAKTIGVPEALAPSDPPWVAVALGKPRVRPKRRDPFGFGSTSDAARRERKRAKREARFRAESRAANAMANLDWEALGGHDAADAATNATEEEEMRACERRSRLRSDARPPSRSAISIVSSRRRWHTAFRRDRTGTRIGTRWRARRRCAASPRRRFATGSKPSRSRWVS